MCGHLELWLGKGLMGERAVSGKPLRQDRDGAHEDQQEASRLQGSERGWEGETRPGRCPGVRFTQCLAGDRKDGGFYHEGWKAFESVS